MAVDAKSYHAFVHAPHSVKGGGVTLVGATKRASGSTPVLVHDGVVTAQSANGSICHTTLSTHEAIAAVAAKKGGDVERLKALRDAGKIKDIDGVINTAAKTTPLMMAVANGRTEAARFLMCARLRSPHGGPAQTFEALELTLASLASLDTQPPGAAAAPWSSPSTRRGAWPTRSDWTRSQAPPRRFRARPCTGSAFPRAASSRP